MQSSSTPATPTSTPSASSGSHLVNQLTHVADDLLATLSCDSELKFKECMKEYCRVKETLFEMQQQVAQLRSRCSILEPKTIEYIESNNLQNTKFTINGLGLKYSQKSRKQTVTLTYLQERLLEYFEHDDGKTSDVMQFIQDGRESFTVSMLEKYDV